VILSTLGIAACCALLTDGSALVTLDAGSHGVALVRFGDDDSRLLVARENGLEVRSWRDAAESAPTRPRLELGDLRLLAYCVAGEGDAQRVYVLDEKRRIRAWNPATNDLVTLVTEAESMLPTGVYPLRFARDLDGDGAVDFAVPLAAGMQLWFARSNGYVKGPRVDHRISIDTSISSWRDRNPAIRQSISIRDYWVEDQNGDGRSDLAFRDSEIAEFFWTDRDGKLPDAPTFTIDLEKIKSALPQAKRGLIDPKNLLAVLDAKVSQIARDLDGDGVHDLVVQKGRNVLVYRGAKEGVQLDKATAALPTSGNLLAVALYDEDGDGKLDIYMLHVGDISLAQVIFWLVASGDLKLELFVYRQDPKKPLSFARKPSSRRTVTISLPSAKSTVDWLQEEIDAIRDRLVDQPVVCDGDGDGADDDLAVLVEGKSIAIHLDVLDDLDLEEVLSWHEVAKRFDRDANGKDELTIELRDIVAWVPLLGIELHDRITRTKPARTIDLRTTSIGEKGGSALFALDLDGDAVDDFAVLERDEETAPPRILFVESR
jgi:FG-GAP-like repeat